MGAPGAVEFSNMLGDYSRGDAIGVPKDHFQSSLNLCFHGNHFDSRQGFQNLHAKANTIRAKPLILSSATRYLILTTAGSIFDSADGFAVAILTLANMTDFALEVINDRAYISPMIGNKGMVGTAVYVYDRTLATTARPIGAAAPTSAVGLAVGAAGNNEIGTHVVAYSWETNTGFITSPGGHASIVLTAHTIIAVTGIANGPAGTIRKHLWMSRAQRDFNGDITHPELFLVATINDNTTTTANINVYDTQLLSSADKYLNMVVCPAGTAMCVYQGRLVVVGENLNPGYARISNVGDPEAFSSTEGFVNVFKSDPGALTNCLEIHGNLFLFRLDQTYSTFDNGLPPNQWDVRSVSAHRGTSPNGIATIFGRKTVIDGATAIIGTRDGLYPFDGQYGAAPLTWKVNYRWQKLDEEQVLNTLLVAVDPIRSWILAYARPDFGDREIFVGNYEYGLTPDGMRWSFWLTNNISGTGSVEEPVSIHSVPKVAGASTILLGQSNGINILSDPESPVTSDVFGDYLGRFVLPLVVGSPGQIVNISRIVIEGCPVRDDLTSLSAHMYLRILIEELIANGALAQVDLNFMGNVATNEHGLIDQYRIPWSNCNVQGRALRLTCNMYTRAISGGAFTERAGLGVTRIKLLVGVHSEITPHDRQMP